VYGKRKFGTLLVWEKFMVGKKIRDFVVGGKKISGLCCWWEECSGKSAFWKSENGKNSWRPIMVAAM